MAWPISSHTNNEQSFSTKEQNRSTCKKVKNTNITNTAIKMNRLRVSPGWTAHTPKQLTATHAHVPDKKQNYSKTLQRTPVFTFHFDPRSFFLSFFFSWCFWFVLARLTQEGDMKTKMKIMTVLCRISSFSLSLFLFLSITLFSRFSSSLHRQHKTLKSGWEAAHLHFFFSFFCFFFLEFLLLKPKPTVPSPLQSEKNKTKTTTEHKFKTTQLRFKQQTSPQTGNMWGVCSFFFGDITTHCTHTHLLTQNR